MDQTSATSPTAASATPQPAEQQAAAQAVVDATSPPSPPGFGARGRVRRRARFLRKARELAYRDLGGLVFSLHRFGRRNDSLVLAKLATLSRIDAELRALESSLSERQPVTVLREAGVTACPRCAAIHSGEDRFCPNCGLSMSRRSDLPIAGGAAASAAPPAGAAAPPAGTPAPQAAPFTAVAPPPAAPAPAGSAGASPAPVPDGASTGATPAAPPAAPPPHTPAAPPARAPAPPATQTHAAVAPGERSSGRSPTPPNATPPAATPPAAPARPSDDDQPTEIIRPRPSGS